MHVPRQYHTFFTEKLNLDMKWYILVNIIVIFGPVSISYKINDMTTIHNSREKVYKQIMQKYDFEMELAVLNNRSKPIKTEQKVEIFYQVLMKQYEQDVKDAQAFESELYEDDDQ